MMALEEGSARKVTGPENPFRLVTDTMELLDDPFTKIMVEGLDAIAKSTTRTVTRTECIRGPLTPVTLAV